MVWDRPIFHAKHATFVWYGGGHTGKWLTAEQPASIKQGKMPGDLLSVEKEDFFFPSTQGFKHRLLSLPLPEYNLGYPIRDSPLTGYLKGASSDEIGGPRVLRGTQPSWA
jgi:hypothetical protein